MWSRRASLFNARGGRPSITRGVCAVIAALSLWFGGCCLSRAASTSERYEIGSGFAEILGESEIRRVVPYRGLVHDDRDCDGGLPGRHGSDTRTVGRFRTGARLAAAHLLGSGITLRC